MSYGSLEKGLGNVLPENRRALPILKQSLSSQSGPFLRPAVCSRRLGLSLRQEELPQKRKSSNLHVPSRPTFLTAGASRRQSRGSQLYGKNQFSIRYRKTGTGHTLTVSPAMIRGEPILSISVLKVPLCRQRFLRACPLYLSPTGPTVKKVEKEARMTSAPGNKTFIAVVAFCFIFISLLLCSLVSLRHSKIKLYEKKYNAAVISLEERNIREINSGDVRQR